MLSGISPQPVIARLHLENQQHNDPTTDQKEWFVVVCFVAALCALHGVIWQGLIMQYKFFNQILNCYQEIPGGVLHSDPFAGYDL